ncbi:hypothetical protein SDC9_93623 [bioreactor metagenome]|uniref:Uncharacterized protein n=1 Tax=bioreactor metagenome TaxID=1076179 RepID=A0A645A1X9_9ZZZZ
MHAAENAAQHGRQVARVHVLHLVDEQLWLCPVVAGLVEFFDPATGFFQVGCPGGDHHDAVDACNGQYADGSIQGKVLTQGYGRRCRACSWSSCSLRGGCRAPWSGCRASGATRRAAVKQLQRGLHLFDGGVLERIDSDRHALEHVHVKGFHHVHPTFGLGARAHHDQHVAQGIHPNDGIALHHGLQDGGHLSRPDELQRNDDYAVTRRQRPLTVSHDSDVGDDPLQSLHLADVIDAARIAPHGQAIDLQGAFQQ